MAGDMREKKISPKMIAFLIDETCDQIIDLVTLLIRLREVDDKEIAAGQNSRIPAEARRKLNRILGEVEKCARN